MLHATSLLNSSQLCYTSHIQVILSRHKILQLHKIHIAINYSTLQKHGLPFSINLKNVTIAPTRNVCNVFFTFSRLKHHNHKNESYVLSNSIISCKKSHCINSSQSQKCGTKKGDFEQEARNCAVIILRYQQQVKL